ncbi:MAG: radical SAM protein [Gammaproteobacteria bacterium]|nr:radical SAM protein [Gammaproteobacteria bacterium]
MAKFVLSDASLVINSVDLSDHVRSVTVNYEAELHDDTTMGDDTRTNLGGLKNWSMDVEFTQDYAASNVDATLFPIIGSTVPIVLKPTSGAVSATNPSLSANGVIGSYAPIGNSVGDLAVAPITISSAGTLTRATA